MFLFDFFPLLKISSFVFSFIVLAKLINYFKDKRKKKQKTSPSPNCLCWSRDWIIIYWGYFNLDLFNEQKIRCYSFLWFYNFIGLSVTDWWELVSNNIWSVPNLESIDKNIDLMVLGSIICHNVNAFFRFHRSVWWHCNSNTVQSNMNIEKFSQIKVLLNILELLRVIIIISFL